MINMDVPRMVCIDILIQIINFTTINHHTEQQILRTKYIKRDRVQVPAQNSSMFHNIYNIYMHVCIYIYIYTYICTFTYLCIYIYIY